MVSIILEQFIKDFHLNFIEDNRYMYLVRGLGNTLSITGFALLIGIVLGFIVGIIRSHADSCDRPGLILKLINRICLIYVTVIRGTPVVVQLLIMYLGVLAIPGISGVLVATITFGINSGAYVAEIVRSGIMSIDKGQMEAARSLGLPFSQATRYIIIPQAFKNILPALANEVIALLKETSICGYIGLKDLTRGGEIIRSNTFSIWMPLLAVASVYLALVMILSVLVKRLEDRLRENDR